MIYISDVFLYCEIGGMALVLVAASPTHAVAVCLVLAAALAAIVRDHGWPQSSDAACHRTRSQIAVMATETAAMSAV